MLTRVTPVGTCVVSAITLDPRNIPAYDNFKTYSVGDTVIFNGGAYRMTAFIGAAGYAPPGYPNNWSQISIAFLKRTQEQPEPKYKSDSSKTYIANSYSCLDNIKNYDPTNIYIKGDIMRFKGVLYRMILPTQAPGFDPTNTMGNWVVEDGTPTPKVTAFTKYYNFKTAFG